jgi:hypothetical protein
MSIRSRPILEIGSVSTIKVVKNLIATLAISIAACCSFAWAKDQPYRLGHATINAPSFVSVNQYQDAVRAYNAHKYAQALGQLDKFHQQADFRDPKLKHLHELTHYYMGLCYQCLNQVNPAQQQYTWVYQNSKDARLRYNSQVAFQQLNYYQGHRKYAGQGNVFARDSSPPDLRLSQSAESDDIPNDWFNNVPTTVIRGRT